MVRDERMKGCAPVSSFLSPETLRWCIFKCSMDAAAKRGDPQRPEPTWMHWKFGTEGGTVQSEGCKHLTAHGSPVSMTGGSTSHAKSCILYEFECTEFLN